MLKGSLSRKGYDWWWHNFTGYKRETGEARNFFIEYFICNPALGKETPTFGQLSKNKEKGILPSYVMIKVGYWGKNARQIHNYYSIKEFKSNSKYLDIKVGGCLLTEKKMSGHCIVSPEDVIKHPEYMCKSGDMKWDLKINKKISFNAGYGTSLLFRLLNAFEMFWHAEGIQTEYSGEVVLDNEIYDIFPEKSFGYADKNWGKDFTSPWLWISSCDLTSLISGDRLENSAIEIGGGHPKVFGISIGRRLLGGMYYEGEMHEYNFSKFWKASKITFRFTELSEINEWVITAKNRTSRMELILKCRKDEMLFANYESPNGKKLHNRLWNGGTGKGEIKLYKLSGGTEKLIDHIMVKNAGCEYGEYDKVS